MDTETKKPSIKDRVLAHKEEIIGYSLVIGSTVASVAISHYIRNAVTVAQGQEIVRIIEANGRYVTPEVDGKQYVIHELTQK